MSISANIGVVVLSKHIASTSSRVHLLENVITNACKCVSKHTIKAIMKPRISKPPAQWRLTAHQRNTTGRFVLFAMCTSSPQNSSSGRVYSIVQAKSHLCPSELIPPRTAHRWWHASESKNPSTSHQSGRQPGAKTHRRRAFSPP